MAGRTDVRTPGATGIGASVGIDVGASKANIGVLDGAGTILAKTKLDIRGRKGDCDGTIDLICGEVERLFAASGLSMEGIGFIGMGVPGTIDSTKNRVVFAPNLGWRDAAVDHVFKRHFRRRAVLVQDARAAALAEYLQGAGKGEPVVVCLTLGTGIGAGIILDGRIYNGGFNTSGEIGHVIVEEDGERCECGQDGCLEAYASGTAIVRAARRVEKWSDRQSIERAEVVFARAAAGDGEARRIIDGVVRYLGMGIVNVVNMLSPNVVVISGGMCEQEELLITPVRQYVMRRAYSVAAHADGFRIEKAMLGEDAPMIGAALLYRGM